LLPAFDSGEHALWVGGPYEGLGIGVCIYDEAVAGELRVNDRFGTRALEALAREFSLVG
jgi:hypothetical protein